MKKILFLLAFLPLFAFGQIPPGANFLIPADTGATLPSLFTKSDIQNWNSTFSLDNGGLEVLGDNNWAGAGMLYTGFKSINDQGNNYIGILDAHIAGADSIIFIGWMGGANRTTLTIDSNLVTICGATHSMTLSLGIENVDDILIYGDSIYMTSAKGVTIAQRSTAPAYPSEGCIYYDTEDHMMYFWNGSAWKAMNYTHP